MVKLKNLLNEVFEDTPKVNKHKVVEGVKNYGIVGKQLYNKIEAAYDLSSNDVDKYDLSNNPIKETWMLVARVKTIPSSIRLIDSIYNKVPNTLKKYAEVNIKYISVL